jgi:hypothetical protein
MWICDKCKSTNADMATECHNCDFRYGSSRSPAGSTPLWDAIEALEEYEQLPTLVEKLQYCQHPKWHTLLKDLVKELTDTTVKL